MTISRQAIIRRGWVVPLCVVLVVVAAVIVAGRRSSYYRAEAVLAVAQNGGPHNTTYTQAAVLATTYAELIAADDRVAAAAAKASGLSTAEAKGLITAVQVPDTAIIDVTFSDADSAAASAGLAAIVRGVTAARTVSPSIPPGVLQVVSGPGEPSSQGSKVPGGPVPIGIVLGLLLGFAVLVAWDRSDARFYALGDVEAHLGLPGSELTALTKDGSTLALQRRWVQLSPEPPVVQVALVAGTRHGAAAARAAREHLIATGMSQDIDYLPIVSGQDSDAVAVSAMSADVVVLVLSQDSRVAEVRKTLESLRQLGVEPRWALLTDAAT